MTAPVGFGLVSLALALAPLPVRAGPCTDDIAQTDAAINARLDAIAAAGKAGAETTFATTHHQPTPGSIAQAEANAGDVSEDQVKSVREDMTAARSADVAGDGPACEKALADARRTLGL